MAKSKAEKSSPTGLFHPCPVNETHHPQPLAVPIQKGPIKFFVRCVCGAMLFLPPDWKISRGLTSQQAAARRLLIITNLIR